jgi:hypothetical protein
MTNPIFESDFEVTPATPEETIQMLKDHLEASEGLIMASCIEDRLAQALEAAAAAAPKSLHQLCRF